MPTTTVSEAGPTRLGSRIDEIREALLAFPHDHLPEAERAWLRARYEVLVPEFLAEALEALDLGTPLRADCIVRMRAAGARDRAEDVPVGTALRGAVSAMRVFSIFLHRQVAPESRRAGTLVLLQRAALIAHELGSAWFEGWLEATSRPAPSTGSATGEDRPLADVERQIVELVAAGRSNAEIAALTHYSRQAVGWHLSRLMRRWQAPNRAALVSAAYLRGILPATGVAGFSGLHAQRR